MATTWRRKLGRSLALPKRPISPRIAEIKTAVFATISSCVSGIPEICGLPDFLFHDSKRDQAPMTALKLRRLGLSHPLFQLGLGTASLGLLCAFGVSIQQLPPQETLPTSQQETAPPAVVPTPSAPVEDYQNDPLFLEIKKIVQQGSSPAAAFSPSNTQNDSVSNSRWHAVESILAAARMLEQEVSESIARNDAEAAAKTQRAIRSLRVQALELLH